MVREGYNGLVNSSGFNQREIARKILTKSIIIFIMYTPLNCLISLLTKTYEFLSKRYLSMYFVLFIMFILLVSRILIMRKLVNHTL